MQIGNVVKDTVDKVGDAVKEVDGSTEVVEVRDPKKER